MHFFAYTIVVQMGHSFAFALNGSNLIAGLAFFTNRSYTVKRISVLMPYLIQLKLAVTAGIGLFIALIGLSSAGLIVSNPATIVSIGDLQARSSLISILGIILIAVLWDAM